jgi:hypothetical protein
MNKFLLFSFLLGATGLAAQDCITYFPFRQGVTLEYSHYDKKNKLNFITRNTITAVKTSNDGSLEAEVETKAIDAKKEKEEFSGAFTVKCKDGSFHADLSSMLPPQMMESFKNMDATVSGDGLVTPSNLQVGQSLPNASTSIKLGSGGASLMTVNVDLTNRRVVAKETISTPAGAFDCYKIDYDMSVKALLRQSFKASEWIAKEVGMVKSETYDKKGNLSGYSLLTQH